MEAIEERELARRERLSEVGILPPCPFCQKPRVQRSDYIRCNPCGINWLSGEDISKDPRASRISVTVPIKTETSNTARTAELISESRK